MEFLGAVDLLLKAADAISGKRAYRKRKRDQLYSPTKASSAKVALKALRQPVVETMALESTMAAESGGSSYTSPPPQPSSSVPATPPKPIIVIHVGFHTAVRFSITGKWATFSSVLQLLRGAPLQSPASFLQLSASWRARNPVNNIYLFFFF